MNRYQMQTAAKRHLAIAVQVSVLFTFLFPGAVALADKLTLRPGMTGVPDLGAIRCETFNHMYPNGPTGMEQAILTWAGGYFYGKTGLTIDEILARQSPESPDWDFDSLTGHIVEYCAAHPEAPVPSAIANLWQRLDPSPSD